MDFDSDSDSDSNSDINLEDDEENSTDKIPQRSRRNPNGTDDKRAYHNYLERKRRCQIKNSFDSLRDAIPWFYKDGVRSKASRAQVLKAAASFIIEMNKKREETQKKIDELREENLRLEKEVKLCEMSEPNSLKRKTPSCVSSKRKINDSLIVSSARTSCWPSSLCSSENVNVSSLVKDTSNNNSLPNINSQSVNGLSNFNSENEISDDTSLSSSSEEDSEEFNSLWENYSDSLPGLSTGSLIMPQSFSSRRRDDDINLNSLSEFDSTEGIDSVDSLFENIPIKEESIDFTDLDISEYVDGDLFLPKTKRFRN